MILIDYFLSPITLPPGHASRRHWLPTRYFAAHHFTITD
jgi:hypothetical protein